MAWNVLILGGGFGGLTAARRLERKLAAAQRQGDARQRRQLHALHAAAAGRGGRHAGAAPRRRPAARAAAPHRAAPRPGDSAPTPSASVVHVRVDRRRRARSCRYDQLIVALGSTSRTLPIPGLAEHAIGFKTLSEAIALRNRVICRARAGRDRGRRRGAPRAAHVRVRRRRLRGPRGPRRAAGLRRRRRSSATRARGSRACASCSSRRSERVMPEIPADLAAFATAELRRRGIEMRTSTTIERVTERLRRAVDRRGRPDADASSGPRASSRTRSSRSSGCRSTTAGGSRPTATCAVPGRPGVWAIGDAAGGARSRRNKGKPSPPTAQHVLRQAQGGGRQRRGRARRRAGASGARSATARSACSSTWAATRRSRARWGSSGAASRPGSSPAPTTWR